MRSDAANAEELIANLPAVRKEAMSKLKDSILKNIPKGFKEQMTYGMIGYVVPSSLYPKGYHCDPSLPLSLMSIASQKNFIAVYHMGIYCSEDLLTWFKKEYGKQSKLKLDMGKSCIRFKNIDQIPFNLIGELASKMTPPGIDRPLRKSDQSE